MVTQMIQRAGVLWHQDDVSPPPPLPQKEPVTIPWGSWVHEKPASRRRSRARAAVEGAGPSSSSAPAGASALAAALPIPPPAAPQPTYLLVQHLFRYMERNKHQIMRCLDRLDQLFVAQGLELPPLPESSGSDEESHEEEQPDLHDESTHEEEPFHVEVPPQTQETQPQSVPQPEPEPTGAPIPDPQD
nr:pleckstrin homology-like domain family A member 1 [Arachis hypogaea]